MYRSEHCQLSIRVPVTSVHGYAPNMIVCYRLSDGSLSQVCIVSGEGRGSSRKSYC